MTRMSKGNLAMSFTAPLCAWTTSVITLDTPARKTNGIFSKSNLPRRILAFKRPVIKKQQNNRQRNKHRLGHKTKCKSKNRK